MERTPEGLKASSSSGGLVSVLSTLKPSLDFKWIGWPGTEITKSEKDLFETQLVNEYGYYPVYLTSNEIDRYYYGFSNSVLWPLFHYSQDRVDFSQHYWEDYVKVNEKFAEKVLSLCDDNTTVWVHDYHLFLLPQILRKVKPKLRIGFFLHIPFPSSEIYRMLPARNEILEGILGSDLIGFHCYEYLRHFVSSCKRVLGLKVSNRKISFQERSVKVGTFPIGIDFDKFHDSSLSEETIKALEKLRNTHQNKKLILGVDRLDYIKGIPQKLIAFENFLEKYPEFRENTILIQVGLPSRYKVPEYKKLKNEIDQHVGRINGRFGSPNHSPIHYIAHSISFEELSALYRIADAMLVTSIRDGMNLVCMEYIASQQNKNGVLILSEFAGAANALQNALLVNPWDISKIVEAIHQALTMNEQERKRRQMLNYEYVKKHTSSKWGQSFIRKL